MRPVAAAVAVFSLSERPRPHGAPAAPPQPRPRRNAHFQEPGRSGQWLHCRDNLAALFLRYCGNKSVAVDCEHQGYPKEHGTATPQARHSRATPPCTAVRKVDDGPARRQPSRRVSGVHIGPARTICPPRGDLRPFLRLLVASANCGCSAGATMRSRPHPSSLGSSSAAESGRLHQNCSPAQCLNPSGCRNGPVIPTSGWAETCLPNDAPQWPRSGPRGQQGNKSGASEMCPSATGTRWVCCPPPTAPSRPLVSHESNRMTGTPPRR